MAESGRAIEAERERARRGIGTSPNDLTALTETPEPFDQRLSDWQEHQSAPWSRLYYQVSQTNLDRHLSRMEGRLTILDVGGGNGVDSIYLTRQGHQLVLVDHSAQMLDDVHRRAVAAGVVDRMVFCQADLADLPELFAEQDFDMVLCHNVAHYVPDVAALLRAICQPLRKDGLLSFISINRYSEAMRDALLWHDPDRALAALDAATAHSSVFDTTIRLVTASDIVGILPSAHCTPIAQYGIRCVNDYISDNEIKADPDFFARLLRLELVLSSRYPYYLLARFFQIIAQKSGPCS